MHEARAHADIFIIFDIFRFAIIMTKHDYQLFGYFSSEWIDEKKIIELLRIEKANVDVWNLRKPLDAI